MAALTANIGDLLGLNNRTPVVLNNVNDNLAERLEAERRRRIDAIDAEIKHFNEATRHKQATKVRRLARNKRDMLILELHALTVTRTKKDGTRFMQAKPGQAARVQAIRNELDTVSVACRPEHGYPCPPPRRSELYPQGGAWKHRKGNEIANTRGELQRLQTYAFNAHRTGKVDVEAMTKMAAHCQRLERKLSLLGTETHIRKQQGTKYYRAVADAR